MPAIQEIAKRRNLFVVEDAAEAHGAEIAGRKVGAFGDAGCFSFYGNKILTTGEGGMVVTDDERLTERLRLLRNQAFEERRFVHHVMGFNYRLTNVQAAIGLAQVERLEEKLARKNEIASWYRELLAGEDVGLPAQSPGIKNVHWMFGVTLGDSFRQGRDAVMRQMRERGVETRAFFCPMHLQPVFVDGADTRYPDVAGRYPVSEDLWNRGLYLPSGLSLTRAQAEEVVTRLQECRG
jgi:perosamine synthetase